MNDLLMSCSALLVGVVLGLFFYGGLWWTVTRGLPAVNVGLWFFLSLVLRLGVVALGFYFVSRGHWERAFFCLIGFVIARIAVTRLTGRKPRPTDAS